MTGKIKKTKRAARRYFRSGSFGDFLSFVGFQTEYLFLRAARLVAAAARAFGGGVVWTLALAGTVLQPILHTVLRDLVAPWRQMGQGLANLKTMLRKEREAGSAGLAKKGWRYVLRGVYVYRGLIGRSLAYLMPIGAAAVFAFTVHSVLGSNFALRVEYRGQQIGFIARDTVFDEAQTIIAQRVQGEHDVGEWVDQPGFTLAVVDAAGMSSATQLADRIVSMSSEHVQQATGVVVNGVLVGATTDVGTLNEAYEAPLKALNPDGDPSLTAAYRQEIELVSGLYFTDTLTSGDELVARLTGAAPFTLPSGEEIVWNILAETQLTQRVTYTEEFTAERQTRERADLPWGEEHVVQQASPGTRQVTADVVYIDGAEVQRNVLTSTVLTEAVPEIVEYGTQNQYGASGEPGDGNFIWPVPGDNGLSRGYITYGSYVYHRGLDIRANAGTPILAADSGVVTFAGRGTGYNWSYGNFVKIDHGNGYTTLYGHMLSVAVQEGTYVSKGTVIGYVGSTGRSSGNHCHFEITKEGVLQNPAYYVSR